MGDASAATSKHASSDPSHTPATWNDNPAEPKSSPTSAAAAYSGQGAGGPASRVAPPVHLQPHPPPLPHRGPAWHDRRGHQPSPAALQLTAIHTPSPVQPAAAGQQPDELPAQPQQPNPDSAKYGFSQQQLAISTGWLQPGADPTKHNGHDQQQPNPATGDGHCSEQQQQSNPGATQRCHISLPDGDKRGWDGDEPFHADSANLHHSAATQPQYHRPHL